MIGINHMNQKSELTKMEKGMDRAIRRARMERSKYVHDEVRMAKHDKLIEEMEEKRRNLSQ